MSQPTSLGSYETKVAFTDFANWLIPGTLLVGRYPYVEPSRCLRREQGEAQLTRILEQGVTTFVSLQVRHDHRVWASSRTGVSLVRYEGTGAPARRTMVAMEPASVAYTATCSQCMRHGLSFQAAHATAQAHQAA